MLKNKPFFHSSSESGQALLIIILVAVIALTVGLSVISRTITNLRTSTEQASSQKALAAAEAGIEQAIEKNSADGEQITGSFTSGATSFTTSVNELANTEFLLNGGNTVSKDEGIDIWLSSYSADIATRWANPWSGNLLLYWGLPSDSCSNDTSNTMAALEVVVLAGTKANPTTTRYAYDPCTTGINRQSVNNFTPVSASPTTVSGYNFNYFVSIPVTQGFLVRAMPLYTGSVIGIAGQDSSNNPLSLPSQGKTIISVGKSDNGTTQRKVAFFQSYPQLPTELFPYTIFSP